MSAVRAIAVHVFRESVRDRVLYNLVLFAVLMIAASYLVGLLSAGQEVKIIKDLGLGATALFGLFIAVFIGIGLVSKEVERRSLYTVLSEPVRRHEVVLGKYVGLVFTLAVNLAVMVVAVYAVLGYISVTESEEFKRGWEAPATDPAMLTAFFLIFVQLMLVTAIALFSRPSPVRSWPRGSHLACISRVTSTLIYADWRMSSMLRLPGSWRRRCRMCYRIWRPLMCRPTWSTLNR